MRFVLWAKFMLLFSQRSFTTTIFFLLLSWNWVFVCFSVEWNATILAYLQRGFSMGLLPKENSSLEGKFSWWGCALFHHCLDKICWQHSNDESSVSLCRMAISWIASNSSLTDSQANERLLWKLNTRRKWMCQTDRMFHNRRWIWWLSSSSEWNISTVWTSGC